MFEFESSMFESATLEIPEGATGILCELDPSGDTRMQWDKNDPVQVAKAETRFNELRKLGYLAYAVNKKGDQGTVLSAFDSNAERVILHSALIGG